MKLISNVEWAIIVHLNSDDHTNGLVKVFYQKYIKFTFDQISYTQSKKQIYESVDIEHFNSNYVLKFLCNLSVILQFYLAPLLESVIVSLFRSNLTYDVPLGS